MRGFLFCLGAVFFTGSATDFFAAKEVTPTPNKRNETIAKLAARVVMFIATLYELKYPLCYHELLEYANVNKVIASA